MQLEPSRKLLIPCLSLHMQIVNFKVAVNPTTCAPLFPIALSLIGMVDIRPVVEPPASKLNNGDYKSSPRSNSANSANALLTVLAKW